MDFQVQGSVFVDGEWVSRTADVYQIMARNQQQEDTEMQEPEPKGRIGMPNLGILSKAVMASPLYKHILPANIRHRDLNDVVFVGEDIVQLKEICDYGHLRHVATKSDFAGKILAARVFGDPSLVSKPAESSLPPPKPIHRARASTTGEGSSRLPDEVIVLTLSSRTLMFLWASETVTGSVAFRQKTVRLPAGSSRLDRPGPFLAIDPKCRAIAVAAREGCFVLYKTRAMDSWRDRTDAGHDEVPIVDEAVIQIEGRIKHMEFLSSGGNRDDSHIVLVFVLIHNGEIKVACYDWDFRLPLNDSSARIKRSFLDSEYRKTSLLIPLSRSPDFLLICDRHITLCRHILSGPPHCDTIPVLPGLLPPLRPGDGKDIPRWVQWHRAPRNPEFSKEAFYVAREDGRVLYVQLGDENTVEMSDAGSWPYPIDTAFACLTVDNSERSQSFPDVLIAGGSGSDGHLFKVGAWPDEYQHAPKDFEPLAFSFVEPISSWAPLADMSVTRLPEFQIPQGRDRASILVANGKAPNGEISELRQGLRALVDDSFGGMKGCTGLWIIDHGTHTSEPDSNTRQHYATFIITLPPESLVIRATRSVSLSAEDQNDLLNSHENDVWEKIQIPNGNEIIQDHVIRDDETIGACLWTDHLVIQIARNEARVLRRPTLEGVDALVFSNALLRATTKASCPFIAIAFRENDRIVLELIRILDDGKFSSGAEKTLRQDLPCEPTCLDLVTLDGIWHIFVSTTDSRICLLRVSDSGMLGSVCDAFLETDTSSGPRTVCESVAILSFKEERILICGMRDGRLLSMTLQSDNERYSLTSRSTRRMGETTARIIPTATDPATAFVACAADFCRIRCSTRKSSAMNVDSLWLVDRKNPSYTQGPITAMDQLPFQSTDRNCKSLGGFIFAVSGDQMVFAQLDYDARWPGSEVPSVSLDEGTIVPRKLRTVATPTKFIYLKGMRRTLAVATTELKELSAPPKGCRAVHSSLRLLSIYDDQAVGEAEVKQEVGVPTPTKASINGVFPLKNSERVYSMVEWIYRNDRAHPYHFIILGTGYMDSSGEEVGRRLVLKVTKSEIKLKQEKAYRHPVRCIAFWDNTHIISIIGKTLSMQNYDPNQMKWIDRGSKELPSAGVHMTVVFPFVYVSTSEDSHICYNVFDDMGTLRFHQIFTDSRQRFSAHHLVCSLDLTVAAQGAPGRSGDAENSEHLDKLVLLADKSCSVTGLFHPLGRTNKSSTDTIFEACLPRSVIRIHRGDIRPPWRRPYHDTAEHADRIVGVVADDILGACSDGTIYSFSILDQAARRLLRLIQNVIELKRKRDPALQFSTIKERSSDIFRLLQNGAEGSQDGNVKARDVDPELQEKGQAAPRFKHVDGDLLLRFFDEDGDLQKLVTEACDADVAHLFISRVSDVARKDRGRKVGTAFEWAENWCADVLMPLL